MVEQHALFEWSAEVALGLGQKYCNWIVKEDPNEYLESVLLPAPTKSESIFKSLRASMCDNGGLLRNNRGSKASFSKYYAENDDLP